MVVCGTCVGERRDVLLIVAFGLAMKAVEHS
jgi:hypothetical protein